ncbi:hypothetical protein [Paenirhodobacter ferrireducens]|nr:hypothetical protein [Sinirhodobacter ferrireducens]
MIPQAASLRSDLAARALRAVFGFILLLILSCGLGPAPLQASESPFFAAKAAQYVALPGELRFTRPGKPLHPDLPAQPPGASDTGALTAPAVAWRFADWTQDAFDVLPGRPPVRPASQAPPLTA